MSPSIFEKVFTIYQNKKGYLDVARFTQALADYGLLKCDPRLATMMKKLSMIQRSTKLRIEDGFGITFDVFNDEMLGEKETKALIEKAFSSGLIIPDFKSFCETVTQVYYDCEDVHGGANASYIPQLANVDSDIFALSVCTVDGQRFTHGDKDHIYTLQSTSKPFNYAVALDLYGAEYVNKYIGQEPSGAIFNEICLNGDTMPHNPMINAGAIMASSLIRPELKLAERYDFINNIYRQLSGGLYVGFNNAVYLSERDCADRNFALANYMQDYKCFPENTDLISSLEFYFQLCSIETKPEAHAVMAATLANGGKCPITNEQVLNPESVKHTLSLMLSCGMYDYSGQFAFKIGLPAKSGVSGAIMLVVPNVMGMVIYSPPLDECGNSYRGIVYCEKLLEIFNFHQFDSTANMSTKIDPRRHMIESTEADIMNMLMNASKGDVKAIKMAFLKGHDMDASDYDQRSALHIGMFFFNFKSELNVFVSAASEGHLTVVRFLVENARVQLNQPDRWDRTPLGDARQFEHVKVVNYLEAKLEAASKRRPLVAIENKVQQITLG